MSSLHIRDIGIKPYKPTWTNRRNLLNGNERDHRINVRLKGLHLRMSRAGESSGKLGAVTLAMTFVVGSICTACFLRERESTSLFYPWVMISRIRVF